MEVLLSESKTEFLKGLTEGKPKIYRFGGTSFAVAKQKDRLFAFESRCPHFDQNLEEATVNFLQEVVCPWHGYRFSLQTGLESEGRCRPLKRYPISTQNDAVYLSLDE